MIHCSSQHKKNEKVVDTNQAKAAGSYMGTDPDAKLYEHWRCTQAQNANSQMHRRVQSLLFTKKGTFFQDAVELWTVSMLFGRIFFPLALTLM